MGTQVKSREDILTLLRSDHFAAWYAQYNALREQLESSQDKHAKLTTEAQAAQIYADASQRRADEQVYRAGEMQDLANVAQSESAEIENSSFEMLSDFERERQVSSQSWQETDRLEKLLEDEHQRQADLKKRLETARQQSGDEAASEAERLQANLRDLEASSIHTEQEVKRARERMSKLNGNKAKLWGGVEDAWLRSFRANMARSEHNYQARRARAQAESQYARSAAERGRLEALQQEAQALAAKLAELQRSYVVHLTLGRQLLGCVLIDEFLFWPQDVDVAVAWVVPLINEGRHFNIQVEALQLYQIERARGLDFLEPVAGKDDGRLSDPRLAHFFGPEANRHI